MSYFKTKNILGKFEISGFGGIDLSTPAIEGKCTDMVNLRILPDRSIVKRNGFREMFALSEDVRGVLSGNFDGGFKLFIVAGSTLYKFTTDTGMLKAIGNIGTQSGPVTLFCYNGKVYVIDGAEIFEIRDDALHVTAGYAPLVGKDWGSNYHGAIHEALNILTPKGRISYIVDNPPTAFLSTYYDVDTVDAVYVNGDLRDKETYGLDPRLRALNVSGLEAGDRVLVYYTFARSTKERERLSKNPYAMVFGGINNSRVFMWGGDDKNRMFASAPAAYQSVEEAEAVFANCGGLYFPEQNDFCVGDGKHEIKAVSRHYDRLLIFTSGETWMADSEVSSSQSFPLTRINTDVGCAALGAVAKCGNDPISVGPRDIYRWTSNTDTLEDCNAYVISDKIKALLPKSFFEDVKVFTDRYNQEILFAYRDGDVGRVLVYSIPREEWYFYDGVTADCFFEGASALGFINGRKVCFFMPNLKKDMLSNGSVKDISGHCTYSANSFGHPSRKKRVSGVMGVGELGKGELQITFESDSGVANTVSFAGAGTDNTECFYKRLRGERFKNSQIKISTDNTASQRIYSLTVTVRA